MTPPLILASASPRRRELLSLLGVPFTVEVSRADEAAEGNGAQRVLAIAEQKGREVFARFPASAVLAADTLVCLHGRCLGKPRDEADAARMLRSLSGEWHDVYTGVCLLLPDGRHWTQYDGTRVHFLPLSEKEIAAYIATGEPMDKAGAYAVQGIAGAFIDRVEGSVSNVIGLPLTLTRQLLYEASLPVLGA